MENDDLKEMYKKLVKEKPNLITQEFMSSAVEYVTNNPDKIPELKEDYKEALELFTRLNEGEITSEELPLLINPTIKEALKYMCKKLLEEK